MGGGGGGGYGPSKNDLSRLEELARRHLKEGDKQSKHNIFISFAVEDKTDVDLLRGQAKNRLSDLEFNDWSLREPFNSKRAEYIKQGISERIKRSSVTIVYVSEHSASSKWVNWEVEESIRLGKGVVAMYKGNTPPSILPRSIKNNNIKVIPWTHKGIMTAIKKAIK
jgi:hypothetical protein